MFEFPPHRLSRETTHQERKEAFDDWFMALDVQGPSATLPALVIRLGENLERILGPEVVEPAMQQMLAHSHGDEPTWRDSAAVADHLLWPMTDDLVHLLAYAVFGLVGERDTGPLDPSVVLEALQTVEALLADCPVERWMPEPEVAVLLATVQMARGRWEFDHRRPVRPEALALLGGVKMSRIRNMLSGSPPELPRDEQGLVLHEPAAAWLMKREVFLPTIRAEEGGTDEEPDRAAGLLAEPLFVPVAKDGSIFHPGLARESGFRIGAKGDERAIADFDEALAVLQRMEVARWRRPSAGGNWGIVAATEWRRMDRNELEALAQASAA